MQQSHHCGIETDSDAQEEIWQMMSSNRTIVGLKPSSESSIADTFMQQSHHCGIETERKQQKRPFHVAAIAPLWD